MKLRHAPCLIVPREALPLFRETGTIGQDVLHGEAPLSELPTMPNYAQIEREVRTRLLKARQHHNRQRKR